MKFEWETLNREAEETQNMVTCRAKVLGGWIVKQNWWIRAEYAETEKANESICCSLVFIPDPDHEWQINDISNEILSLSVEKLNFKSQRTLNCMRGLGVETIDDLLKHSAFDLLKTPNFGYYSLRDVRDTLAKYDLKIKHIDKISQLNPKGECNGLRF